MTIALGVLTPVCAIIAADSQESYGDEKSDVSKVTAYAPIKTLPSGGTYFPSLVITGSGDSGYLQALKRHIIEDFEQANPQDPEDFDAVLRGRVASFYRDHVIPFRGYKDMDLRVNVIVCVSILGRMRMWRSELNDVRNLVRFELAVAGTGEKWARTAIGPFVPVMDEQSLVLACAYGVYFAKEYSGSCGKNTQLFMLRHNLPPILGMRKEIDQLDTIFRRYDSHQKALRNSLLGIPHYDDFPNVEMRLRDFRNDIVDIVAQVFPPAPTFNPSPRDAG